MNIYDIMTLFNLQFFITVSILKFKRILVSCYQGNGFDFCDRFTDTTHIKLFSHFNCQTSKALKMFKDKTKIEDYRIKFY